MPDDIKKVLFQTALRYLGYRDRFKKEIEVRLKKEITKRKLEEESSELIPSVLDKLERSGLIDDQSLIDTYIKTQQDSKLRGPYFIKQKLSMMGAPREQVNVSISKLITSESQQIIIDKLIKKRQPDLQDMKSVARFQRFLAYRGFDINQIRKKIDFVRSKG